MFKTYPSDAYCCFVLIILVTISVGVAGYEAWENPNKLYFKRYDGDWNVDNVTSPAKIKSYFEECPYFKPRINHYCNIKTSCNNRCGTIMSEYELGYHQYYCSCDAYCGSFDDCCWDVATHCPEEQNATKTHLYSVLQTSTFKCYDGFKIINGCALLPANKSHSLDDPMQPIVTSKSTGLHFFNPSIYKFCFYHAFVGNDNGSSSSRTLGDYMKNDALFWSKVPVDSVAPKTISEENSNYVRNALLESSLYNLVPPSEDIRLCKPTLHIHCMDLTKDEECNTVGDFKVRGSDDVCTLAASFTSANSTTTTSKEASDPQGTAQTRKSIATCYSQQVEFSNGNKGLKSPFSIIFNFNEIDEEIVIYQTVDNTPKTWGQIKCVEGGPCNIIHDCSRGFLFNDEACARPFGIIIEAVGTWRFIDDLDDVIANIVDTMNSNENLLTLNMLSPDTVNETFDGVSFTKIRFQLGIVEFNLSMGELKLQLTESFADHFRGLPRGVLLQATVCFTLLEPPGITDGQGVVASRQGKTMACDRFVFIDDFIPYHFTVIGLTFPPFVQFNQSELNIAQIKGTKNVSEENQISNTELNASKPLSLSFDYIMFILTTVHCMIT